MKREAKRPEWEERWQSIWEQHEVYKTPDNPKDGLYILDMFPYPSAQGLHVGHPEGYTASDIYARFMRHQGKDVLHPMGFDSFGLPAENYAIKTGTHPAKTTSENIDNMRRQIKSLGFSYNWNREVITSDPAYYKWTQWIFLKLFEAGLAYEADAPINWCPKDKTGLANEEVVNGKCERCGTQVTKKKIKQWLVKITDRKYIDRLLDDLKDLDWPENIKDMQAHWIGRSEGAEVDFEIQGGAKKIIVFTTRPDTLFGATYMVLSPEHPLVDEITTSEQKKQVEIYCKEAAGKSDLERTELAKEKTGIFTGAYAVNPVNKKSIPIWVADYVLASYGTGAIMAVPAHDERDHAFAKKYKLPIIQVIKPHVVMPKPFPEGENAGILGVLDADIEYDCWTGDGKIMNSGEYNKMDSVEFRKNIVAWLEKENKGRFAVNYKMRDWLFSRQRYWGEPIPIVHCEHCKKETEATPHYLNFRIQSIWDRLIRGEKSIESRVLNPEEPNRYFGHIKKGEVIKCINKNNGEAAYFEVTQVWKFKNIADLFKYQDIIVSIKGKTYATEKELRESYESLRPGYAEKIKKDGLIAWKLRRVYPGLVPVPEKDLPLKLPDVEKYEPTGTGESPLAAIDSFVNTKCPKCGSPAIRETNTMPQWAGSNWYFLRYTDPKNEKEFASSEKIRQWMPVEMYIGGAEHAVLHLLYARFIYKFLYDLGVIPKECGDEPFKTLKNQGLILGEDMQKMSKSRGNVVNPDDVINSYGADVMRMYEMFMGPFEDSKPWSTNGMVGIKRFLDRVEKVFISIFRNEHRKEVLISDRVHATVKKVEEDIINFKFNTAISELMTFFNSRSWAYKLNSAGELEGDEVDIDAMKKILILLSPFAPHLAEELWQKIHGRTSEQFTKENSVTVQPWPTYDESKLQEDNFTLVVMINGKRRDDLTLPKTASESEIKEMVFKRPNVKKWTDGKKIKMEKYVTEKIYTIVVQ